MYKITLIKSSRKLPILSKSPKVMYWSIIPITSHLFQWAVGAETNRLPFQVCPQNSVYHTLQKMSNNSLRYATNHIFQQITKCNKAIHCNHLPCVELHKWEGMLRSWTTKRFCFNAFLYKCKKSNFNKIGRCHQIKQISIEKNILFFKTKRTHWQAEIFVL